MMKGTAANVLKTNQQFTLAFIYIILTSINDKSILCLSDKRFIPSSSASACVSHSSSDMSVFLRPVVIIYSDRTYILATLRFCIFFLNWVLFLIYLDLWPTCFSTCLCYHQRPGSNVVMDTGKHPPGRHYLYQTVCLQLGPLWDYTPMKALIQLHFKKHSLPRFTDTRVNTISEWAEPGSLYNLYLAPSHKLHHVSSALIRFKPDQWRTWTGIRLMNRNKPSRAQSTDLISGISHGNTYTHTHTQIFRS